MLNIGKITWTDLNEPAEANFTILEAARGRRGQKNLKRNKFGYQGMLCVFFTGFQQSTVHN